ncbi:MAG: extracellular solute-binding protein [Actinobacteria bacterium]|nr:extracellular solute-binding protein [Actinomycetota bacterium]
MSRWKVLGAAAAVGLAVSACTGGNESAGGSQAPASTSESAQDASLKWLIEEPEDAEALAALEEHVAEFETASGIDIQIDALPFDTMRTILQTQLRAAEGPDVFSWGSGPGFGGALIEAGLVHDITDAYAEHGWEVYDFAVDRVTVDGKIYGIPGEMETIGVFYNADIFNELGLDAPQNLEEFRTAMATIRDAGLVPLAVGDKEGWEGGHLLSMALSSDIESDGLEALFAGEASWDSPEVVSALELWRDFHEEGFLPESPTAVDYDGSIAMFYSGEAAMIPTGSWLVGEIDDNTDFEVGYIPFPGPDGPGIFAGGLGSGPFISANTSHKDAAVQFLDFLASPEHAQWTVENLHTIPPIPIDTDALEVSPLLEQVLEDIAGLSGGGDFGYNIDVMTSDQFNEAMYDGMQALFTGQATPQEVAARLEAAASS